MRWRRNSLVLWRSVPDFLVLATADGRILEVSGSAPDIWQRLAEWIDDGELTRQLAREFATDERALAADVMALLQQLHELGYVDAAE